jgi:hypothetical protein
VTVPTIAAVCVSGRFDATRPQILNALDVYADEGADVMTWTEVGTDQAAKALDYWCRTHGWDLHHPQGRGKAECAVLVRKLAGGIGRTRAQRLTHLTLRTARSAPLYAVGAEVHFDDSTLPVWFWKWHSPAHNDGLKPGLWPTRVYRAAMVGLRTARRRVRGGVVIDGDWNVSLERPAMRAFFRAFFPRLHWTHDAKTRGTHGNRLIDGTLTNLRVIQPARTLTRMDGFDHQATLTILALDKEHHR